jgi:hypothetical protein
MGPKRYKFSKCCSHYEIQAIGVKDRTTLIIWAKRINAKNNLLKSFQTKAVQMEQNIQEFKDTFEQLFIKGLPPFWDGKGKLYDQEEYNSLLSAEWIIPNLKAWRRT